jgi:hypothetical protein
MLPLLCDEDVPKSITDGLRQYFPGVDVVRAHGVRRMRGILADMNVTAQRETTMVEQVTHRETSLCQSPAGAS